MPPNVLPNSPNPYPNLIAFSPGIAHPCFPVKTLHLYLARQVLATLGMTVFVFTFVLLLGNVIKEILDLLINRQATLAVACQGILLLIPYVLAFSLPIGMLTAALLVFGRFSADQELTAARASGISLVSLLAPVLLVSVAVSGLCAWLNLDIAPSCRTAYTRLLARAGRDRPGGFLLSNQYVPFGKYQVFAGHVHDDGTNLDNVIVSEYDADDKLVRWAKGPTGVLCIDYKAREITLVMPGMKCMQRDKNGWVPFMNGYWPFEPKPFPNAGELPPIRISDMTFRQLRAELARQERGLESVPPKGASRDDLLEARKQLRTAGSETIMPVLVYMNQQVAFSFACFAFTLIGTPLGIRSQRRETSIGVATALVLVLVYYSFMVLAQAWAAHPERFPCLIIWLPNFIFESVGAVLLWRINKRVG
jgi:lipopolysaccharide export system permease protein